MQFFESKEKTLKLDNFLLLYTVTDKSFSEALILPSTNPQYDKRLFIELPVHQMKTTSAEHAQNMARTCSAHVLRL